MSGSYIRIFGSFLAAASAPQVIARLGFAQPQRPPTGVPGPAGRVLAERMFLRSLGVEIDTLAHRTIGDRFDMMRKLQDRFAGAQRPGGNYFLTTADLPWGGGTNEVYELAPLPLAAVPENELAGWNPRLVSYRFSPDGERHPLALLYDPPGGSITEEDPGVVILTTLGADHRLGSRHLMRLTCSLEDNRRQFPAFPTVYEASTLHGTALAFESLKHLRRMREKKPDLKVLVLGTGSGLEISVLSGLHRFCVDAVDINPIAVSNTLSTATYLGVDPSLVRAWRSDLFEEVPDRYDAIVFNAPHPVRRDAEEVRKRDINISDLGGRLLTRTLDEVADHLTEGGALFLMSLPSLRGWVPATLSAERVYRTSGQNRRWEDFAIYRIEPKKKRFGII